MPTPNLLRYIAHLAFQKNPPTNPEIAKLLVKEGVLKNPNKKKVAELIQDAGRWLIERDQNLQRFENPRIDMPLSVRLRDAYARRTKLNLALVPHRYVLDREDSQKMLSTPSDMLRDHLERQMAAAEEERRELHVAISGGNRILDALKGLATVRRPNVHFYAAAAIGRGNMRKLSHITPEINATIAWEHSGMHPGHLHYVTVPPPSIPIDSTMTPAERYKTAITYLRRHAEELYADDAISKFISDLEQADLFVCDVTSIDGKDNPFTDGLLDSYGISIDMLKKDGVKGAINYEMIVDPPQLSRAYPEYDHQLHLDSLFLNAGYARGGTWYFSSELFSHPSVDPDVDANVLKDVIVLGEKEEMWLLRLAIERDFVNVVITDQYTARHIAPEPLPSRQPKDDSTDPSALDNLVGLS